MLGPSQSSKRSMRVRKIAWLRRGMREKKLALCKAILHTTYDKLDAKMTPAPAADVYSGKQDRGGLEDYETLTANNLASSLFTRGQRRRVPQRSQGTAAQGDASGATRSWRYSAQALMR